MSPLYYIVILYFYNIIIIITVIIIIIIIITLYYTVNMSDPARMQLLRQGQASKYVGC